MLLIAQLLKCQLVLYMVQEKFWKINFYWWYYQNSYCCYHVADKWIFQNQRKLGPQRFFFKKVVVVMSWYHSVKIAGNLSNKKLSSACDFIWVLQFFSISCRYFVEQLWSFSLNNSFKQKVKTKHSVLVNVPNVIHIDFFFSIKKN